MLASARNRQARFERLRRSHLPRGGYGSTRHCYEIVGRYCLRHGDEEWEPIPEPGEVKRARDELNTELERAARLLPGDEWIAGQRVRYLVEAGRQRDALAAAMDCRAALRWWCLALEGYALHSAGTYVLADSAFAAATLAMPERERCRWTDIADLLSGRSRRHYGRLDCDERGSFEARFWWLADPLHMLPANDRWTEHFARRVLDRMQHRADSPFGAPWGADLRELLVRYGWPGRFEKISLPTGTGGTREGIAFYDPQNSWQFIPRGDFLETAEPVREDGWRLEDETPRSVYAPAYASSFQAIEHQLAVFPRGDSAIVVAAYQLQSADSIAEATYETALILSRDPGLVLAVAKSRAAAGVLSVVVETGPTLLSLEMLSDTERQAARSRYGLPLAEFPNGLLTLSDLLLLDRADRLPASLAEATPLARRTLRARSGERLGLYWEVYGLGPGREDLSVSLTLVGEGGGVLRRAAEWLGLARRQPPITLAWQEAVPSPVTVLERSLAIDLPDLQPGRYTLMVEVTALGREKLRAARSIEIVR
ncbi:MAG: hypothetical protein JSV86_02945 [Gemmatimonadota bacterium]|nr:MAG: hypothetical protein JSV86_02945 [Gemmatimonadota bacterium]